MYQRLSTTTYRRMKMNGRLCEDSWFGITERYRLKVLCHLQHFKFAAIDYWQEMQGEIFFNKDELLPIPSQIFMIRYYNKLAFCDLLPQHMVCGPISSRLELRQIG